MLLLPRDGCFTLLLELSQRRDAEQVALPHHAERLRLEDHVERLVPRDVLHADRHRATDVVGRHDVHPANLGEQTKDVVDVGILEVEVDAATGVLAIGWLSSLRRHLAEEACDLGAVHLGGVVLLAGDGAGARTLLDVGRREHPHDAVSRTRIAVPAAPSEP